MRSSSNILLFGGTGHLGRDLIPALGSAGAEVRIASRRQRKLGEAPDMDWVEADLATGRGVKESLSGIQTILFCAGSPKQHAAVEIEGMHRLLFHARSAELRHFIFVSIVGIEHLPVPYYRTKLAAEQWIRESGVPFTILRATQFHYFVAMLLSTLARTPFVLPVPKGFFVQPVATQDVAARLIQCLADGPRGLLKDYCGPEIFSLMEAATLWKQARGIRKPVVSIPVPGELGAAFREGHNTNPAGERGVMRWSEWLSRKGWNDCRE